jgi:hypothetical protein
MQVNVQLKTAQATVASSLGYESDISAALEGVGLRMYPAYPGTQDSKQATMYRVPIADHDEAERALGVLRGHEGVQRVDVD